MRNITGRLPLILVLVVVAASAAWTTANARSREWTNYVRSQAPASTVVGSSRIVRPADGEPDVGGIKNNQPPSVGHDQPALNAGGDVGSSLSSVAVWFARIGMSWMARYLGPR